MVNSEQWRTEYRPERGAIAVRVEYDLPQRTVRSLLIRLRPWFESRLAHHQISDLHWPDPHWPDHQRTHTRQMDEHTDVIDRILDGTRTVAVVGLSPSPSRPSHGVAAYLQGQGFRVIPVNPNCTEVLGERSYPDLAAVPEPIDLVDIFRRSEFAAPVVEQAVRIGAKYIWMQDGVIDDAAAEVARAAGLAVVMDDCIYRQHRARRGA